MRRVLLAPLVPVLLVAAPATAQTHAQAAALAEAQRVSVGAPAPSERLTLKGAFDPSRFQMSHSVEFSTGSMGPGGAYSLGMYTNTVRWQLDERLAARLDLAVATSPTGLAPAGLGVAPQSGVRAFVRNAELTYRPSASTELRVQFQQNPYGGYGSPYGYDAYGAMPYGYGPSQRVRAELGRPAGR